MNFSFNHIRIFTNRIAYLEKRFITNNSRLKKKSYQPIHLSQKPAAVHDINFNSLGLKFPINNDNNFVIDRLGWAPPPAEFPVLPFMVTTTKFYYMKCIILYKFIFNCYNFKISPSN